MQDSKRLSMGKNFKMLAKTLHGLEDLLARELRQLGASNIEQGVRNVTFEAVSYTHLTLPTTSRV